MPLQFLSEKFLRRHPLSASAGYLTAVGRSLSNLVTSKRLTMHVDCGDVVTIGRCVVSAQLLSPYT